MKFTDYPEATVVNDEDLFLISTENGIRKIKSAKFKKNVNEELAGLTELDIELFDDSTLRFGNDDGFAYLIGNLCVFSCDFNMVHYTINSNLTNPIQYGIPYNSKLFRLRNPNTGKIVVPVTNNFSIQYVLNSLGQCRAGERIGDFIYNYSGSGSLKKGQYVVSNATWASETSPITFKGSFIAIEEDEKEV